MYDYVVFTCVRTTDTDYDEMMHASQYTKNPREYYQISSVERAGQRNCNYTQKRYYANNIYWHLEMTINFE
ncbi:14937_t:CDS:2 [Funneliformis mosseae]|uniref:14937_t:CDS:1 n=1 Tax=Funneliformis mosseae TaxID=27381 RepID=A0A9N8VE06_FUNMO|nr:14937_t:CDS:2 [Funneliformis mosseae]